MKFGELANGMTASSQSHILVEPLPHRPYYTYFHR
jgi:hypothetical protein